MSVFGAEDQNCRLNGRFFASPVMAFTAPAGWKRPRRQAGGPAWRRGVGSGPLIQPGGSPRKGAGAYRTRPSFQALSSLS